MADIFLKQGREKGCFNEHDPDMSASIIKAMLQDWYLKRKKYAGRNVSVDEYADFIIIVIMAFLKKESSV